MGCHFFLIGFVLILNYLVDYAIADAPYFVSAHGITVLSSVQLNNELYEIYVTSNEVRGMQKFRVLVPRDYATSGSNRRYPVLYLLHGAYGNPAGWTYGAQTAAGNASLITVMPNGDQFGCYTNWVIPGNVAPQNWRTHHMEELVPWIDFNFRTVARKEGRAIAGLSMGGLGAIRYAQQYPQNFAYMASFSGLLDLLDTRVQQLVLGFPTADGIPHFGPFGSPLEPLGSSGWFAQDPLTHTASLRGVAVAIYTGNNDGLEKMLSETNYRVRDALTSLNIPFYFNDYGNGQSIGYGCNGGHTIPCWNAALIDVLPRIMAVLQQEY